MKKAFVILTLLTGSFVLIHCSPKTTKAVEESNTAKTGSVSNPIPPGPMYSEADVASGHTIYENNCGKCHKLYDPANFNDTKWTSILKAMIPKAKLSETDAALVKAYVFTNAKKG